MSKLLPCALPPAKSIRPSIAADSPNKSPPDTCASTLPGSMTRPQSTTATIRSICSTRPTARSSTACAHQDPYPTESAIPWPTVPAEEWRDGRPLRFAREVVSVFQPIRCAASVSTATARGSPANNSSRSASGSRPLTAAISSSVLSAKNPFIDWATERHVPTGTGSGVSTKSAKGAGMA